MQLDPQADLFDGTAWGPRPPEYLWCPSYQGYREHWGIPPSPYYLTPEEAAQYRRHQGAMQRAIGECLQEAGL